MDTKTLIGLAEAIAKRKHAGHLTLMCSPLGWKAYFGTPPCSEGKALETLNGALFELIAGGKGG